MAFYESTFIARQELSSTDVDKITSGFSDVVKKNGGKVIKSEYWGLRSLAYPINKSRKGHYVHIGIEGPTDLAPKLEKRFKANEDVVRSLIVRVEEISKEASAPLNQNDNNDDYKVENEQE